MSDSSRMPTARDVAKLAGVSQATVSYVLSGRRDGDDRISEETRQRVLDAVDRLHYVPNQTARNLRRQRTERVCLVLPRLGVPYYDRIARDLQKVADTHDYSVIITVAGSAIREQQVLEQLRRRLADGALIVDPKRMDENDLALLVKFGLSIVVWSNRVSPRGFDVWRTTDAEACHDAIAHLVGKGHRRIAFLGQISDHSLHYQRYLNWVEALRSHDIDMDERLAQDDNGSREGAYHVTRALLQLDNPPSAILAASDIAGISAIWAARDTGLTVPDDIAIIGMGNIPEGEIVNPPLTTMGSTAEDFQDAVAALFVRLIGRATSHGKVYTLPWRLIIRGSA